jgi:hypothetical protein
MTQEILGQTYHLAAQFLELRIYRPDDPALPIIKGFGSAWEAGGCPGGDPESALLAWHERQSERVLAAEQAVDRAILSGRALLAAARPNEEEERDMAEVNPL